jgi:hypothetical protein
MSYLFPIGSDTEYGMLEVGSNIEQFAGIISIPQNMNTTSSVIFDTINVSSNLTLNNESVITEIVPVAGYGINISDIEKIGSALSFVIDNGGVTKLTSGTGIHLSNESGDIVITATGSVTIKTVDVNANYLALEGDEYIGVSQNPTIVTLPHGIIGKTYIIKNEASGTTTVKGTDGEKIDNSTSKNLNSNASITVVFNNGQWRII